MMGATLEGAWLRFLQLEPWLHLVFGVMWVALVAGLLACALRGKAFPRETVAWAVTGVIFYAMFLWPGWFVGIGQ